MLRRGRRAELWTSAWRTTRRRRSRSLRRGGQRPRAQQDDPTLKVGDAWDHYFPFYAENVNAPSVSDIEGTNSFLSFLRFSYYRPRDISSMIATIQDFIKRKRGVSHYVTADDFNDPSFRDAHAEYLLGELRDQLLFYYSQYEFDIFLQFFSELRGKMRFSYDEFVGTFNEFVTECGCGSPLSNRCAKCGADNSPSAKFCEDAARRSQPLQRSQQRSPTEASDSDSRRAGPRKSRRRAQDGHRAVRRHQGLDRADGGPRSRRGARDHRSGAEADDRCGPSLRRLRRAIDRRRHLRAVRRAGRA